MKLSVIVVNRNACALLKQSLNFLISGCKNIDYELIIVDNASTDKSVEMIRSNFPDTHLIDNDTNLGIAAAYNQALKFATGEYVLLVSPDTLSGKDTIEKMLSFADAQIDTGGLGVRMLTPQGRFLPESVHGLSTAWAAFFKFIGFAKYLAKTRLYDRNRKDWVEEFQIAEVDILNGAYMLVSRSALNEAGIFDERFFKFGYDIDLSYRLRLAGFKNYYYPKTYVIKSETQPRAKFSWDHIKYFYGAMFIFAVKYLLRVPEIKVESIPQLFPQTYEVK